MVSNANKIYEICFAEEGVLALRIVSFKIFFAAFNLLFFPPAWHRPLFTGHPGQFWSPMWCYRSASSRSLRHDMRSQRYSWLATGRHWTEFDKWISLRTMIMCQGRTTGLRGRWVGRSVGVDWRHNWQRFQKVGAMLSSHQRPWNRIWS